jgi:pseudouridine-5'-phosphate glycosidase
MGDEGVSSFVFSEAVALARRMGSPILALESAVITHGLPQPENLQLARALEAETRAKGVTPATIAVLAGKVHVGLTDEELERLAMQPADRKISRRDYGIALGLGLTGGTTVAGTLIAAERAGIRVFATGGIGGVHRGAPWDVSADLPELARRKLIVVCSGAKAVLDLPATVEYLETAGVPILGYRTEQFPAFYTRSSGLGVDARVESAAEVVKIALAHWAMGLDGAVLVVQPPPDEDAPAHEQIERAIEQALSESREQGLRGAGVTPFLLARVGELSGGDSLRANLALLRNNARLGAEIAACLPNSRNIIT